MSTSQGNKVSAQPLPVPSEEADYSSGPGYLLVRDDNYDFLADGSVDLVLTDPPFNIARKSNFHTWEHNTIHNYQLDADKGWDTFSAEEFRAELSRWSANFYRVLRKGGSFAVFCADAYVSHLIDALTAAGLQPKRTITWRKPNAVPVNRGSLPMSACEFIVWGVKPRAKWTFNSDIPLHDDQNASGDARDVASFIVADKVANVIGRAVRDEILKSTDPNEFDPDRIASLVERSIVAATPKAVDRVQNLFTEDALRACVPNFIENPSATGRSRIHPTEKPVMLLRYLVSLFSNPGDLVLDPFAGSGSTAEAAVSLDRRAVLIERDEDFFQKATERLLQAIGAERPESQFRLAI